MMMALKAQMHEDRTLPPGPPACIEVEDSPVEVHTPPPKTSVPPDTPDDLSREKVRNPLARQLSFSDIRQRLKCWQFMKKAAASGPIEESEVSKEGSAEEKGGIWSQLPLGGGIFVGGRYFSRNKCVMDPYLFEEEDYSMLNGNLDEDIQDDDEDMSPEGETACGGAEGGGLSALERLAIVPWHPKGPAHFLPHPPTDTVLRNSDQRRLRGKQAPKGKKVKKDGEVKKDAEGKKPKSDQLVPKEEQKAIMETLAYIHNKCSMHLIY